MADPRVIAFMNEEVRPLAQEVRALKAAIDATAVRWFAEIAPLVANDAKVVDDGRAAEGVSQLTGADIVNLVTQLLAIKTVLDGGGVAAVIQKPCVRRLEVK
jgi:malonyl CoA-acyl carrier protein transacylase